MSKYTGFDQPAEPTVAEISQDLSSQLSELRSRALADDAEAIRAIADLGRNVAITLRSIWRSDAGSSRDGMPRRRNTFASEVGSIEPLPVLHYWGGPESKPIKEQARMIAEVAAGPLKLTAHPRTRMRVLVERILSPHWRQMKTQTLPPEGIDREIWALQPLDATSLKAWADVFARWLWDHPIYGPKLRDKESRWYRLADPMRALEADRTRSEKRLARAEKRIREDPNIIKETRLFKRRKRIAEMQVQSRHIKAGLKQALTSYFKRNLAGSK